MHYLVVINIIPFFIHLDLPPINTNPAVNVSLENKQCDNPEREPVEPVFKCLFDEPSGGPYWYDTYWYINTDIVKLEDSQLSLSEQPKLAVPQGVGRQL